MTSNANIKGAMNLGDGAQFWVYISPQNDTAAKIPNWEVTFVQGNWTGRISSSNPQQLQTPGLSGEFLVTVTSLGKDAQPIQVKLQPLPGSTNLIGCNSNCASMVGIVAAEDGDSANFWTTWDAMCKPKLVAAGAH